MRGLLAITFFAAGISVGWLWDGGRLAAGGRDHGSVVSATPVPAAPAVPKRARVESVDSTLIDPPLADIGLAEEERLARWRMLGERARSIVERSEAAMTARQRRLEALEAEEEVYGNHRHP